MALSIYNHDEDSTDFRKTPVYGSCSFTLKHYPGNKFLSGFKAIDGKRISEITGICDEVSSISYTTTWEDGPGATFVSKIKDFTQSEAFKMFGGPFLDSNPATGQWTQQYPKEGCNISVSLKFRAYKQGKPSAQGQGYANTTSYMTLIQWLTYITSPQHDFDVGAELSNIGSALSNAKEQGEQFGEALNKINDNGRINKGAAQKAAALAEAVENSLTGMASTSRSQVTCLLQLGDIFKMANGVEWIVESWDFTPSIYLGESDMPLYCDFNISLSTNEKLSSSKLKSIL